jgi:CheY-like chemotaxis protein
MPFKVFGVEGNLDTRELLQLYFTNAGYTVPTTVDGQEGLYMAKMEKPDVIITDITMPNMDGLEMTKQIRADSEITHIPILVFTALSSLTIEYPQEAGANKFSTSLLISMS